MLVGVATDRCDVVLAYGAPHCPSQGHVSAQCCPCVVGEPDKQSSDSTSSDDAGLVDGRCRRNAHRFLIGRQIEERSGESDAADAVGDGSAARKGGVEDRDGGDEVELEDAEGPKGPRAEEIDICE